MAGGRWRPGAVPPVQVGTGPGVYHLSVTLPPYIDGLLRVFGASFILFMF